MKKVFFASASLLVLFICICSQQSLADTRFNDTNICQNYAASPVDPSLQANAASLTAGYTILMSSNERLQLMHELQSSNKYFEFGCGGSTMLASRLAKMFKLPISISSVDSSYSWVNKVREDPVLAELGSAGKFFIHWVDIGELGDWGNPTNKSDSNTWPLYSESIWKYGRDADLVLVDGRFRVACALQAVLLSFTPPNTNISALLSNHPDPVHEAEILAHHTAHNAATTMKKINVFGEELDTNPRAIRIMIHDFFRQQYHKVLQYTDVLFCVDSLVVLQPKRTVNLYRLINDINAYKFHTCRA